MDDPPVMLVAYDHLPEGDPASLPPPPTDGDEVRWIYFTSGTTSDPKGVQHSDATLIAGGTGLALALDVTAADVGSIAFPFDEERFQSLLKMRPRFGRPDSITIIPWPKYATSLIELGIWDRVVRRYADTGSPASVRECERCHAELVKLEREELRRAITGEQYETLWGERGVAEVEEALVLDDDIDEFDDDDDGAIFEEDA